MQTYSNVSAVPLALGVFLATDHYDANPDPLTISTTTLLKPLRQILLANRLPSTEGVTDLASMMANRLGSAIHDGIERSWRNNYQNAMSSMGYPQKLIDRVRIDPTDQDLIDNPEIVPFYMEQRASKKVGKWTVTGKWDFIGEGRVQDYKTASVWSYKNQVNADKQIKQGSIYRWLDPKKITQDQMDIHHIFMDWKAGMVKTDPGYPPQRFHKQTFNLLSIQETEQFIRSKLASIDEHWNTEEEHLPFCSDEDLWRSAAVFKFYKNGDTSAARSTKNFDTLVEARLHQATVGTGAVKEVPGQVKACTYCAGFAMCTQKDSLVAIGDLVL
jgi:hypothetical protein